MRLVTTRGSISGILVETRFNNYFHQPSNGLQGGITTSIQARAFVGSLMTGIFLTDALGRRRTILCGAALFTNGTAISCASNNVECLIAGHGIANGCTAMMVPLWQSEVTPKEIRGRIISLQQCVINFGILSSFLIQYGVLFHQQQCRLASADWHSNGSHNSTFLRDMDSS